MADTPDPYVDAIIEHGVKLNDLADEEGALILSLDLNPMRDKVEQKGESRAVEYERWENPRIEGEFSLRPRRNALGKFTGLGNMHPGAAVTDLVNLPVGSNVHGFRISASCAIIMGNAKQSRGDEGKTITQPFTYNPFTKSAAALAGGVVAPPPAMAA